MDFLMIYGYLCQRLLPCTQVSNANMFRLSDSEDLIGVKKNGEIIAIVQIVSVSSRFTVDYNYVAELNQKYPYLRLFALCDGVNALYTDLFVQSTGSLNIDGLAYYLRMVIREEAYYCTNISLPDISRRNNIDSVSYKDKKIIIFDDHRTTLDVLFEIYKSGQLDGIVPNLVTFDYHEDCCNAGSKESLLQKIGVGRLQDATSRQFWSFVEFDLSTQDDDWISAAMNLDLVRDVVILGHNCNNNVDNRANRHDATHHLYSIEHLSGSVGNRGCLGDSYISDPYYEMIRDTMQYHHNGFDSGLVYPFILDIDLDCFSTEVLGHTVAWPEDVFRHEYVENDMAHMFMIQLIKRASLITISREHGCCGGLRESSKILGYLDKYFFQGSLLKINTQ